MGIGGRVAEFTLAYFGVLTIYSGSTVGLVNGI
jgi:hypothetical protein